jgi:hypothetical protein
VEVDRKVFLATLRVGALEFMDPMEHAAHAVRPRSPDDFTASLL